MEAVLKTYLVQDTISSEVLLIPQVSLTENRLVPNTELKDLKNKMKSYATAA